MPEKGSKGGGELRRFEPVSDELVLAAVDRAERHRRGVEREGVTLSELTEHLGFVRTGWTTRQLRPQLAALVADGLLAAYRRSSRDVWELTVKGRSQLDAWRRRGDSTQLPESPQHRVWRNARTDAAEQIEEIRRRARGSVVEALALLDSGSRVRSDRWFELARRLRGACWSLGSATYCLYEWAEPDDARADIDDYRDPSDERLEPPAQDRLNSLRQGRRHLRQWGNIEGEGTRPPRPAPNGDIITVPAELVANLRIGLHHLLGTAAEDVADITSRPRREQHPEWYEESRVHLEQAWALLDLIGWADPRQQTAARIDLRQHRWAATGALDAAVMFGDEELAEADVVDAERAERGQPSKREATIERARALREFTAAVKKTADATNAKEEQR